MDHESCVRVIFKECTDRDGFLVKLRTGEFSQEQYNSLFHALQEFREMIRDQEYIEREVAYCLYFLDIGLLGAVKLYPKTEAEKMLIKKARYECSQLIIEILTPESLKNIPTKL
jgi:hypothetical protein